MTSVNNNNNNDVNNNNNNNNNNKASTLESTIIKMDDSSRSLRLENDPFGVLLSCLGAAWDMLKMWFRVKDSLKASLDCHEMNETLKRNFFSNRDSEEANVLSEILR